MKQKALLLLLFCLFANIKISAVSVVIIDGIGYIFSGDEASVGHLKTYSGSVVIPEYVTYNDKRYHVTGIGDSAFFGCSGLTSVTIPNSVTSIDLWAFRECSGLTSVTIGNGVTSIGYAAFYGCNALNSIIIPNSVTSIGITAFVYCSGLTSVTIGNHVTSIGDEAFAGCSSLTSVTIPSGVTSIGYEAFAGCSSLTSVTIPSSVTSIGYGAFAGCIGLTSVIVEEGNTHYDSRNDCNAIIETETNTLISGCQNTIISNSVTSIGYGAFWGCIGLTSITIPESVTSIGDYAFSSCSGLTSVTIPESVTSIGRYAFSYCSSLTSVTIPNSVTNIGECAFYECRSLKEIYCYVEEAPEVSSGCFYHVDISKVLLVVPDDAVEKYKAHPVWGQFWIETPTGINEVESSKLEVESSVIDCYDIQGHKLSAPQHGINIIRMSDGTTRKVMVK